VTPDRFFSLLLALQSRPETTVAALADETGVSARTVIRDLNWLRDAGFPVLMRRGKYGGVFMLPGDTLDAARLTPREREHLTLTRMIAAELAGTGQVVAALWPGYLRTDLNDHAEKATPLDAAIPSVVDRIEQLSSADHGACVLPDGTHFPW
jgi:predicted DNA-binding transcriptional regulator YafY